MDASRRFFVFAVIAPFLGQNGFGQITLSGTANCSIPYNVNGQTLDVYRAAGLWYEYMVSFDEVLYNGINNVTIRGTYPGTNSSCSGSYFATFWLNFYTTNAAGNGLTCGGLWQQGNLTVDGKRHVMTLFAATDTELFNLTFTTLFNDYNVLEIVYTCNDFPVPTDNICRDPSFWVFVRIQPTLLTDVQKTYIQNTVNDILKPMCRSFADMKLVGNTPSANLPPCNSGQGSPAFPAIFAAAMPKVCTPVGI
ncbi:uncharacterized protein LOC129601010 [Paramacrobiotus metropolitanus]|uniref:uncharacterized protein LOC129601010 n=1 Tax=Paramacrobiotus metropolitanus TaxID=2943436 RepID=UPI002446272D|nr:uncharacterized protein LOC129601010 [Paramacrobiotus metropolitanus]